MFLYPYPLLPLLPPPLFLSTHMGRARVILGSVAVLLLLLLLLVIVVVVMIILGQTV